MKVMRGSEQANDALNGIIRRFNYQIRELRQEESISILSNVAIESFAASNPTMMDNDKSRKGYPLGQLAQDLVIYLTSFEDEALSAKLIDVISKIPHLYCYGLIEETYTNINKQARRIDTIGGGDWPLLMKTMALPLDDRVFVQRQSHLISRASAMIGKAIHQRMEVLAGPMGKFLLD